MSKDCCPNCRTRSGLNNYKVILISFENLPFVLLSSLVVMAFGEKFAYSTAATALFAFLASIPQIMRFDSKTNCENCGMDFRETKTLKRQVKV